LVGAVVDLGTERVQRNATLVVALGATHLRAAQATGANNLDALDLRLTHCTLDRLAHSTAECNTVHQLLGDGLSHQLSVGINVLDFVVDARDLLSGEFLELASEAVSLGATTADHYARTCGVEVDAPPVVRALDDNVRDAPALDGLGEELADLDVFGKVV